MATPDDPTPLPPLDDAAWRGRLLATALDVKTLTVGVACHDLIASGKVHTLAGAADALGLPAETVYDHVTKFEAHFHQYGVGGRLFVRKPGRNSHTTLAAGTGPLFERLRQALGGIDAALTPGGPLRVRVGASLTMATNVIPRATAGWPAGPRTPAELVLSHGQSRDLLARLAAADLDFAVTAVGPGEQGLADDRVEVRGEYQYRICLLCNHEFDAPARPLADGWAALRGMTVVLLDSTRRTAPAYPEPALRAAGVRLAYVDTYEEAFALTLSSRDAACFAVPHVLADPVRRGFQVVEVPPRLWAEEHTRYTVHLLRSVVARKARTDDENAAIDALADRVGQVLKAAEGTYTRDDLPRLPPATRLWYVTKPGGDGAAGWKHDPLALRFGRDGLVRGTHDLTARPRGHLLRVEGSARGLTPGAGGEPVYQVTWTAAPADGGGWELYAATLFCRGRLDESPWVGVWSGCFTDDPDRSGFFPAVGYMVVTGRDADTEAQVEAHVADFIRHYPFVLPERASKPARPGRR